MSDKLERLEHINSKMNKITQELAKNVELSEDMLTTTEELNDFLSTAKKTAVIEHKNDFSENSGAVESAGLVELVDQESKTLSPVNEIAADILNISDMQADFNYMRENLKATTDNSKRILESITDDLIYSEGESRAELIIAYSELNKAQMDGIKLFIQSYKEVSTILVNLSKVQTSSSPHTVHTTNVLNIENDTKVSTADIINRLKGDEDE